MVIAAELVSTGVRASQGGDCSLEGVRADDKLTDTNTDPAMLPAARRTGGARPTRPGLITRADDDDPSGIATYSQTGAQFGYASLDPIEALLSRDLNDCIEPGATSLG
jgi:hypothetical protein